VLFGFTLLGLKPGHACDAISVVAEFMVDVARLQPGHACDPISSLLAIHALTIVLLAIHALTTVLKKKSSFNPP
jgi:hypothetical protein